jgi:hypothetical protein
MVVGWFWFFPTPMLPHRANQPPPYFNDSWDTSGICSTRVGELSFLDTRENSSNKRHYLGFTQRRQHGVRPTRHDLLDLFLFVVSLSGTVAIRAFLNPDSLSGPRYFSALAGKLPMPSIGPLAHPKQGTLWASFAFPKLQN